MTEQEKNQSIEKIIAESSPRHDFFLMVVLAVLMATFGLMLNNTAVVIGSMLVAPILSPLLSMSLGIVMADFKLIARSFITIVKSLGLAIPASTVVTLLFMATTDVNIQFNSEIISRMEPSILYAAIALVAGLAASFAMIKPNLNESLPGVAVSVALIPPLGVTGIGLAFLNWSMIANSFMLFLVNAVTIILASLVVFSLMNLYTKKPVAERVVEKEEKKMELEKKKANEVANGE